MDLDQQTKKTAGTKTMKLGHKYLIGKKYGNLKVVELFEIDKNSHVYYWCECDCGNLIKARKDRLLKGTSTHCGCKRKENLSGMKFGRLLVIKDSGERKANYNNYKGSVIWECKCECGNITLVRADSLKSGRTQSCGCLQYENGLNSKTHGQSRSRLYRIYNKMKTRCYNENNNKYDRYGGRGIIVCEEWLNDYELFHNWAITNGYKDNLSIDRINNDGNYEPNNCRWVDNITQSNNKSTNIQINYKGKIYTRAQLSRKLGINYETLRRRMNEGWNVEDIKAKYQQGGCK